MVSVAKLKRPGLNRQSIYGNREVDRNDGDPRAASDACTQVTKMVAGTTADAARAAPNTDHGAGLNLLAAVPAAAGVASTTTCVTLLLFAERPNHGY